MRRWRKIPPVLVALLAMTASAVTAATVTITFNSLTPNSPLDGQYPAGTVDWGSGVWIVSGPWGNFATNSISFANQNITTGAFTLLQSQRPISIDASNGGTTATTLTFACVGQPTKQFALAAGQWSTLSFGWTSPCSTVTVSSTNSWWTNFTNLVLDTGSGPIITGVTSSSVTGTGASISWTTNVASTSQVEYGTTAAYGSSTSPDNALVTPHSVNLSGLSSSTQYHYRVRSQDSGGRLSPSGDYTFTTCAPPFTNPIVCENQSIGNPPSQWTVSGSGSTIEGFATDISVNKGSTIQFKVNTPASAYTLDIYRMGYYGGNGARKVASITPSVTLPQRQPACLTNTPTGLIDCGNWTVSSSWAVPASAVSGIYFVKLTRTDVYDDNYIFFVVRDDASASPVLFQTSDTTWQAYNSYGGNSLYGGTPGRAYKVSYNRPFVTSSTRPETWIFADEYPMVRWLEANGYNVSYSTGVDSDRRGNLITNHRVFMSVGHDEYWSGNQRTNVEAARAAGVNLAFFSGNEVFWKTRWENSIDGTNTSYRTLISYKETHANATIDPADPPTWTGTWRDPRFSPPADGGRPENGLSGTMFMVNGPEYEALVVPAAQGKLRLWRNTIVAGLQTGQSATLTAGCNCLLGYEWNVDSDNGARPAGLVRLSSTTANVANLLQDYGSTYAPGAATHNLTMYKHASGAVVFSAGTVNWARGLDAGGSLTPPPASSPEPAVQQATVNLLGDMGVQPGTLQSGLVFGTASTDTTPPTSQITAPTAGAVLRAGTPFTISGTAADVAGQVGGVEVSVDGGSSWHPASGLGNWSYAWTPTTSGSVTLRSRAVDDSGNLETPSAGVTVTVSGGSTPTPTLTATPSPAPGTPTPTATSQPTCPTCVSVWPSTSTPAVADQADNGSVELGLKFMSDVSGTITGVRFYKGITNTGTHIGSLWTNSGTLLASATFTSESPSGWQQVSFATPVAITANTTYVVSYHTSVGQYAVNTAYFATTGVDNAPLHAPSNAAAGGNGVYLYSANTSFPTNTFNSSNYWVDVVLLPSPSGATPTPTATRTPTPTVTPTPIATPTATLTPIPGVCPCNLWPGATPAVADQADNGSVELGLKFMSDVSGTITGVRFYKGITNTGTHVGSLWTNSGTLLASATFTSESPSGWQQVSFATPVAITANTTYVVSYHTSVGQYAVNTAYFATTGVDNAPLHAPSNAAAGGNGVYLYSANTSFPTNTFNSSNYWVDVVFNR